MEKWLQKRRARWVILLIVGITILASISVQRLTFNYSYDSYFPMGDDEVAFLDSFNATFAGEEDYLLAAVEAPNGALESDFLMQVKAVNERLRGISAVHNVYSILEATNHIVGPLGELYTPRYINFDGDQVKHIDTTGLFTDQKIDCVLLAPDTNSLIIQITLEKLTEEQDQVALLGTLHQHFQEVGLKRPHLAGWIHDNTYTSRIISSETWQFAAIAVLLLVAFLLVAFRSFMGLWVPIAVVVFSVIWLLGGMAFTGHGLTLISSLMPAIIFVVGISDVVHLLEKYIEELRLGQTKIKALYITMKEVGMATFLTSITTAIGFLTLMTSSISPIREFGIETAIGVLIAYALAITLLPALLAFARKPGKAKFKHREVFWNVFLHRTLQAIIKRRRWITWSAFGVILIALFGISKIDMDNRLLETWDEDEPIRKDYTYFDDHYHGFRTFDVMVWSKAPKTSLFEAEVLAELAKIDHYLEEEYKVKIVASPVTIFKNGNMALHRGSREHYAIPEKERQLKKTRNFLKRYIKPKQLQSLLTYDRMQGRITGKVPDWGGMAFRMKNDAFNAFITNEIDTSLLGVRLTGTPHIIDLNSQYISSDLTTGITIAFAVIALIVGWLFRSLVVVLISLVCNALPLLLIGAVMGYLEIDLNVTTSIIFTIAFGIAVDDTIHFVSRLKFELNRGLSMNYALKNTYLSTGKAIILTTIILCSGFLSLTISSVETSYYVGLLVTLALLFAVVADLVLLPALLLIFYKNPAANTSSETAFKPLSNSDRSQINGVQSTTES